MATLDSSIVAVVVPFADPAAAASAAIIPKAYGLPDITDVANLLMPFAGTIVGITVEGAPASGDTVTVTPTIGASRTAINTAVASLATVITNAAPAASTIVSKDQADAQFAAGQFVGLQYVTTTGGTYTAADLLVTLYIMTGRESV